MDTFTCGTCSTVVTDLDAFLSHKQIGTCTPESTKTCEKDSASILSASDYIAIPTKATGEASRIDVSEGSTENHVTIIEVIAVDDPNPAAIAVDNLNPATAVAVDNLNPATAVACGDEKQEKVVLVESTKDSTNAPVIYVCNNCDTYSASLEEITSHCTQQHNVSSDITNYYKSIKPLSQQSYASMGSDVTMDPKVKRKRGRPPKNSRASSKLLQSASVVGIGNEAIAIMTLANQDVADEKPKRKRGRPRKTDQVPAPLPTPPAGETKIQADKCQTSLDDENLMCGNCMMKFTRLRQMHSHRCLADDSAKELTEHEAEESDDDTSDMKVPQEKKSKIIQINVSEEDQLKIEKEISQHEIPQFVNDKAPAHPSSTKSSSLKVYTCPYCEKFFKFKQGMIHHIRVHTGYKPYKCQRCNYASISKGNLKIHERKHTGERFKCSLCSFTCISKGHIKVHNKSHKKIRIICELCHKNVYNLPNLLRHLQTSHRIDKPGKAQKYYETKRMESREGQRSLLFQCNICMRKFKSKHSHDTHLMLHQDQKPFQCSMCNYKTVRQRYLDQHFQRHRQVYICSYCSEKHLSIQLLTEHLQSHMTVDNEQDQCFTESINSSIYLAEVLDPELESAHLSRVTSGDLDATSVDFLQDPSTMTSDNINGSLKYGGDVVTEEELKQIFGVDQCMLMYKKLNKFTLDAIQKLYGELECKVCGKLFMYKAYLDNHARIHQEEKEFKCLHENCDYSSHSRENLKIHKECTHSGRQYNCTECGFQTTSSVYLQSHMRKHVIPDAFKCTQCDARFGREQDIKNHIVDNHPGMLQEEIEQIIGRRTHIYRKQGKEWFQCKNCAQKFHKIAELRQHVWIHEGVAPYKCEICGHGSRNMSNLKSHMMRHSDTKTHLCDECGKAFKTKNSLKIHNLSQHANIGQKDTSKMLLMCNLCDFTCVQKSQLKKHWDMHGKIRPYRCGICIQYFCNTKSGLRSHYSKQHPEVEFDETLLQDMQVPEDTDNGSLETITQYKCTQCETVCSSYHILEDHLLKQHNVEIAGTSSEETAAGALIQAAAMAESSSEQVVTGDSDLHIKLPSNSAVQLLQQIINMQGLGHLSSGSESQVQIQLPIPNSISEAASAGVENSTVPVYAINEDQAMIHAVTEGTTSQSGVSEGQEQEGSSIMQVQFRVEDGEVGQQIFITQGGSDGQTYVEVPPEMQQAEVVQISISSGDEANLNTIQHQQQTQDDTTQVAMQQDSTDITNVEIPS